MSPAAAAGNGISSTARCWSVLKVMVAAELRHHIVIEPGKHFLASEFISGKGFSRDLVAAVKDDNHSHWPASFWAPKTRNPSMPTLTVL
jgi:hypothetical protein